MDIRVAARARARALAAALVAALTIGCTSSAPAAEKPAPEAAPVPAASRVPASDRVSNAVFYYGGTLPLEGTSAEDLTAHLGRPGMVVTTPREDEAGTVDAIHSIGAKAYRYIQFYWAPGDADYEGINLKEHPDWAFCRQGSTPSLGRTTNAGAQKWYFIDANETAVRTQLKAVLAGFKADGWDGVFFDRGEAATQYAKDIEGRPVWSRPSSCTEAPYREGARFADAYVNMLGLAHQAGLEAMMNNGKSPFDPVVPMRPDPADRHCRTSDWTRCSHLSDAWQNLDLVLNETAGRPKDTLWERTFIGNRRSENRAATGRPTVALITTASLGGRANQTRHKVFYQWSRIKLFNLAVAVNTGDDNCASADPDAVCNRYGVYPELVNTNFGRPRSTGPESEACVRGSDIRCLWLRRYAKGVNLLNASARTRPDVTVRLGTTCRHVWDVFEARPLARDRCVRRVSLTMPPWSGRPLRYSTTPWRAGG